MAEPENGVPGDVSSPGAGTGPDGLPPSPSGPDAGGAQPPAGGSAPSDPIPDAGDRARAEIHRLKQDPDFIKAFTDRLHQGHRDAVTRMQDLHGLARKADAGDPVSRNELDESLAASPPSDVRLPDGMTPEQAVAVLPPETPDDYNLTRVEFPEGIAPEDAKHEMQWGRAWAHDIGLSQAQFGVVIDRFNHAVEDESRHEPEYIRHRQQDCVNALNTAWGDDAIDRLEIARKEVDRLGDGFKAWLEETRLGDDPFVIKIIYDAATRRDSAAFQALKRMSQGR